MKILLTGGAGYIGSHTCISLEAAGHDVVILDNFCNSTRAVLPAIAKIIGKMPTLLEGDIRDVNLVTQALKVHEIDSVVHFAALKSIGESLLKPLDYYNNNVVGLTSLLSAMDAVGCRRLVFSSSATVYCAQAASPVRESCARSHSNPYAHTKVIGEDMLATLALSNAEWKLAILRYFNPVGAHESGLIGEQPRGTPSNLMPYVSQVAIGQLPYVRIFGDDYATFDGTGVRDFVHVMDLAEGHTAAISKISESGTSQPFTVNLGTGKGYSVRQVIQTYSETCGHQIPFRCEARRDGDLPESYADVSLAAKLLNWRATRSIVDMCADAWRWQQLNPGGLN
jgi:UDP-glucose 4-epimerase